MSENTPNRAPVREQILRNGGEAGSRVRKSVVREARRNPVAGVTTKRKPLDRSHERPAEKAVEVPVEKTSSKKSAASRARTVFGGSED